MTHRANNQNEKTKYFASKDRAKDDIDLMVNQNANEEPNEKQIHSKTLKLLQEKELKKQFTFNSMKNNMP